MLNSTQGPRGHTEQCGSQCVVQAECSNAVHCNDKSEAVGELVLLGQAGSKSVLDSEVPSSPCSGDEAPPAAARANKDALVWKVPVVSALVPALADTTWLQLFAVLEEEEPAASIELVRATAAESEEETTRPRRGAVGDAPRVFGGGLSLGFFQKRVVW